MAVRTPDPDPEPDDDGLGAFDGAVPSSGTNPGWLSDFELEEARRRLPMLYVEAIPVRTDGSGVVTEIGILLRSTPLGEMTRTIVSGRGRCGGWRARWWLGGCASVRRSATPCSAMSRTISARWPFRCCRRSRCRSRW